MLRRLLKNSLRQKRIDKEVHNLNSSDESTRSSAARNLLKLQWSPPDEETAAKFYLALGDFASLSRLGPDALPYLYSLLQQTDQPFLRFRDSRFRESLARTITEIGGFEGILTLYTDYGFHAFARDRILDPEFIDFLFQRLPELELPAQRKVVEYLLDADPQLTLAGLKKILTDPLIHQLTREKIFRIFELLQMSGDPEALRRMEELTGQNEKYAAVAGWTRGRRLKPEESLQDRFGMCRTCKTLTPLSEARRSSDPVRGIWDHYYYCPRCDKRLLDPEGKTIKDISGDSGDPA
jgi:hypothetical protein